MKILERFSFSAQNIKISRKGITCSKVWRDFHVQNRQTFYIVSRCSKLALYDGELQI